MKYQLNKMLVLVATMHQDQFDKGGMPYVMHCLAVMQLIASEDEELMCTALGHDLVEDTDCGYTFLRKEGFSERVINGIRAMTKQRGQSYAEYKAQVTANPDAVRVKMADLTHNSDIRRLKGVTEKDIARVRKYHEFYLELKAILK